jgi:amylovoran biosynthesis glycosyltransferase AmsD
MSLQETLDQSVTKRRRVAVFINDMNAAGGIQRVAANLVRDLQPRYEMMLLSVEPLGRPVFHEPQLQFRSLGYRRGARTRLGYCLEFVRIGWRLRRFVAANRIDTVLAIWFDWSSVAALALPRRVKKIGCEHISFTEASPLMRRLRAWSYPNLDAVVSLTQEDVPLLAAVSRSVRVIPNYVRPIMPGSVTEREKILLTVGHLESRKGIDRLLWALKQPLLANPDWKLVIVGGGEKGHVEWAYMDYVAALLQMLKLGGCVEFHPTTSRIDEWYRRASIYVLGSRREGLPMVLIEAKAHGLPIVAFDCPTGPKEIVRHGTDGFLVADDSGAFAEAATKLIADAALRRRMSDAALDDYRERFSPEVVISKWHDLIDAVHAGRRSPAAHRARHTLAVEGVDEV